MWADVLIYSILALGYVGVVILWLRLRRISRELQRLADVLGRASRPVFTQKGTPDA